VPIKQENASSVQTIGSPRTLKLVFTRTGQLAFFQFPFWQGGDRFDFSRRPILTALIGMPGATLESWLQTVPRLTSLAQ
jgi:hypothetical protein